MLHVMFVDDDRNILNGLRRMLHMRRRDWKMSFANGGGEAVDLMERDPADMIVCDMRMPGMDGAEVLKRAAAIRAGSVRMVLSGQATREATFRSIGASHQFLAKPCSADELMARIDGAASRQQALGDALLADRLTALSAIPTLPDIRKALVAALADPGADISDIQLMVLADPGLSIRLLQLANSGYIATGGNTACPADAARMIDIDLLRELMAEDCLITALPDGLDAAQWHQLADHALTIATLTERRAVLAGELDDMRRAAYATGLVLGSARLLAYLVGQPAPDSAQQRAMVSYLACLWGLPPLMLEALDAPLIPRDARSARIASYLPAAAGVAA